MTAALIMLAQPPPVVAGGQTDLIAISGQASPDGNGIMLGFSGPANPTGPMLNQGGTVAFHATLGGTSGGPTDNRGIFFGRIGEPLQTVVRTGTSTNYGLLSNFVGGGLTSLNNQDQISLRANLTTPPNPALFLVTQDIVPVARQNQMVDSVFLSDPRAPMLNDAGVAVFSANAGVFRFADGAVTPIALSGTAAPGTTGGTFGLFTPQHRHMINNFGTVAFSAGIEGGSGGSGIFRRIGTAMNAVVRTGLLAPAPGSPTFQTFGRFGLADGHRVTFLATLSDGTRGIYFRDATGPIIQLSRTGLPAPGGGYLADIGSPAFAGNGRTAYRAALSDLPGEAANSEGIFLTGAQPGDPLLAIARRGQAAPDDSFGGTFLSFQGTNRGPTAVTNWGLTLFGAALADTPNSAGIYLGDGIDLVRVAQVGQAVEGTTISALRLDTSWEAAQLNDRGQVAYGVTLADGRDSIILFTPQLNWRSGHGNWDDRQNWTLGIRPDAVHDVVIDPASAATISGPATAATVRSLTLGQHATLALGGSITSLEPVNNAGALRLIGPDAVIASELVVNDGSIGIIVGNGTIAARLANQSGGQVTVPPGRQLHVTGPWTTNRGFLGASDGAEAVFSGLFHNIGDVLPGQSGRISVQGGALRFNGGLINQSLVSTGPGTSHLYGNIVSSMFGRFSIVGGGQTHFHGDLSHNGLSVLVAPDSAAIFHGNVSGTRPFVGPGTVIFNGGLAPGNNSIARLSFEGDVVLGSSAIVQIDIGGRESFDALDVAGSLWLDGTLEVLLVNGFQPAVGDRFRIFNAEELLGGFHTILLPDLGPGMMWNTNPLSGSGQLLVRGTSPFNLSAAAVPEPATGGAVGILSLLLLRRRGRR